MQYITQEHCVSKDLWALKMTFFIVSLFYVKKKEKNSESRKGVWNDLFVKSLTIGPESKPPICLWKTKASFKVSSKHQHECNSGCI